MKLSSCDVTSCDNLWRYKFCFSRKGGIGGGGWVDLKGADSMVVSGLRYTLDGSEWATAVLLCMNRLGKQSSHPARHPFPAGKHYIPFWVSACRLSAMTIASSLMGDLQEVY